MRSHDLPFDAAQDRPFDAAQDRPFDAAHSPADSGEALTRTLFIRRLERLVRLRREYSEDLNPLGLRLLDRAISSTYKDLLEYGAGDEIRQIVARHPVPGWDTDIR